MMRKIILILLSIGLAFSFTLPGPARSQEASKAGNRDERSVTRIVKDREGVPIMEVYLEYLGKKPKGPMPEIAPDTWKKHDTDFYNIHLRNLTDDRIELIEWQYISDDVVTTGSEKERKPPLTMKQDGIARLLGGYIIEPKGDLVQRNSFKWSSRPYARTVKVIKLKYKGRVYQTQFAQIYKR